MRIVIPIERNVLVEKKCNTFGGIESFLKEQFVECDIYKYVDDDVDFKHLTYFYVKNEEVLLEIQQYTEPHIEDKFILNNCIFNYLNYNENKFELHVKFILKNKIFFIDKTVFKFKFNRPSKYEFVIKNSILLKR